MTSTACFLSRVSSVRLGAVRAEDCELSEMSADFFQTAKALSTAAFTSAGHEDSIEPKGGIFASRSLPQLVARLFGKKREKFEQRNARIGWAFIAPFRRIAAVDDCNERSIHARKDRRDVGNSLRAGIVRPRQRLGIAHQRAQGGVFLLLD